MGWDFSTRPVYLNGLKFSTQPNLLIIYFFSSSFIVTPCLENDHNSVALFVDVDNTYIENKSKLRIYIWNEVGKINMEREK